MLAINYLTVEEAAEHLRVSKSLIYKKITTGDLSPVLRLSQKLIGIPIDTLKAFERKSCPQSIESNSDSGAEKIMASGTLSPVLAQTRDPYQLGQQFVQRLKSSGRNS